MYKEGQLKRIYNAIFELILTFLILPAAENEHFLFMIELLEELSKAKLKACWIGFASNKKFARIWREASLVFASLQLWG